MVNNYNSMSRTRNLLASLLVILFATLGVSKGWSQTTYQIGTGTSTGSLVPINTCYGYNYSQQIYTAAQMTAAGASGSTSIDKIAFFYNASGTPTSTWDQNWDVYIGNTSATSFASTTSWISSGALTQYYSGAVSATAGSWVVIQLTTPFVWDGTSNIVVAVDENTASFSCTATFGVFTSATNTAIYYRSDSTNPNPASPPTASGRTGSIPRIQFITPPVPCVAPVAGGTATASSTALCNTSTSFTLGVTGDGTGTGITYEWEGWDGSAWIPTGVTTASWTTNAATYTQFRRRITCSATDSWSTSISVSVAFTNCYPAVYHTNTGDEDILGVTLGANTQTSNCSVAAPGPGSLLNRYGNYKNELYGGNQYLETIQQGNTAALSLNLGTCAGNYGRGYKVWIDYNADGSFDDATETVASGTYASTVANPQTASHTINIPISATVGVTGMRVSYSETTTLTSILPGSTGSIYGEVEDYLVNIIAAPACETVGTISGGTATVTNATPCAVESFTINVTGATAALGLNYEWYSSTVSASGPWTLMGAETGASLTATASVTTYYYRSTVCAAGPTSGDSNVITVTPYSCTYDVTRAAATMSSIITTGSTYTFQGTSADDNTSQTVSLAGTTFQYMGTAVTGFQACTNGWLTFNTSNTSNAWGNGLSLTTPNRVVAAFWDDLVMTGNSFANANSCMRYEIAGTLGSGSAVITLEWAGMERFSIPGPNLNFQVKLYESNNNIEIIYGEFQGFDGTVTSSYSYSIGHNGANPAGTTAANRFGMVTPNTNHWSASTFSDAHTVMPTCSSKFVLAPGLYTGPTSTPASYTAAPFNDDFASSTTVPTNSQPCSSFCGTYFNSRNATASVVPVPTYASSVVGAEDDDVWFDFTTSALVTDYLVRLRCAPGYDGVLQVYDGSLNPVGTCQNATTAGGIESSTVTGLATSTQYFVRVWSNVVGSGTSGEFSLCVSEVINPPTNDEITTATALTATSTCVTTASQMPNMLAATSSGQTVNCGTATPASVADVWYSWLCLSPNDAVTVTGGTGFNPAFNIYSSSDNTATGTLTSVTCQNATGVGGTETFTGTTLVPGNTYFVRVYHALGGSATGNFNICVVGSSCWTPTAVAASGVVYNGALVSWTAPANASNLDFEYAVTTTNVAPTSGTLFTSNATSIDLTGTLSPLTTYYFWVRSNCAASENSGWVSTSFTTPGTPPANDLCSGATNIACGGTYTGSTIYATIDNTVASTCGGNTITSKGVWFKYTGNDQVVTVSNCAVGAFDSKISVYSGDCGTLTCVGGNDDNSACLSAGLSSEVTFPAFVGTDYYVLLHGFGSASGSYVVSVTCEDLCISSNDECSTADPVAVNGATVSGDNTCAYPSSIANPSCESAFDIIADEWYLVNSGYRTEFDILFEEGATNPANGIWYGVELYTGSCGALTAVSGTCQIVTFGTANSFTGLTWNTNYYVRFYLVDPIGDGSDTGNYDVTVTGAPVCSGVPTISTPSASESSACSGVNFTLQVENVGGYLYQWQRQVGLSWVNISGATNYILTTSQTAATNYRCRVTCVASSALTISPVFSMPMNTADNCYPASFATTPDDEDITVVTMNAVANNSDCSVAAPGAGSVLSQYSNFTGTPTWSFVKGEGVSWSVKVEDCEGSSFYSSDLGIFVDFNYDGDFLDAGEELFDATANQSLSPSGSTTFTGTFVVPTSAITGNTRMRIISNEFQSNLTGAGTFSYGETEDYTVAIVAPVSNDTPATAQLMSTPTYPSCANVNGTVVGATDGVAGVVGDDVWYRFTATSSAYRIATTGASGDVSLELMDATGTTSIVAAVNNNSANSDEVLVATGLTPSTVYTVRVINQSATPASFTICAQAFGTSGCAYGSSYSSICSNFKSIWTGATSYSVAFTDGSNNYTGSSTTTTLFGLNTVVGVSGNALSGGLRYSTNYTATVTANYVVTLAGGAGTTTVSLVGTPCSVNISAHPAVALRTSDASSGVGVNPRAFNSFVAAEPWLCDVVSYDWKVQEIDPNTLANVGLEYNFNSGSTSRFIRLNAATCAAFHTGGRYKISVRPVFAYGAGTFGTIRECLIAGVAPGMTMENADTEVVLVDKINEGGVFASLYPNPNTGESVNLNIAGIESESVNISIMDASGRVVWSNRYVVDGALFTTVNFDRPLAAGMYMVEMVYNGQVMTQRMMVQK